MNIYPAEIEAALEGNPDIYEAAVFGIPSEEWGELVHAGGRQATGVRPRRSSGHRALLASTSPATRCRARSHGSTSCRRRAAARSSSASCVPPGGKVAPARSDLRCSVGPCGSLPPRRQELDTSTPSCRCCGHCGMPATTWSWSPLPSRATPSSERGSTFVRVAWHWPTACATRAAHGGTARLAATPSACARSPASSPTLPPVMRTDLAVDRRCSTRHRDPRDRRVGGRRWRRRGIPHVTVAFSGALPPGADEPADRTDRTGGPPRGWTRRPSLRSTGRATHPFPPSFGQLPEGDHIRSMRAVPVGSTDGAPPEWLAALGVDRPLVYSTFGTESASVMAPWTAAVEVLGSMDVDAVVTIGPHVDPDALGPARPNVRAERFVPQSFILDRAAVVMSHAGAGSLLGAAPSACRSCSTRSADQWENADAASGAAWRSRWR